MRLSGNLLQRIQDMQEAVLTLNKYRREQIFPPDVINELIADLEKVDLSAELMMRGCGCIPPRSCDNCSSNQMLRELIANVSSEARAALDRYKANPTGGGNA
jgi:uncharacterized Fe-S cluster-containing MiaB family protein